MSLNLKKRSIKGSALTHNEVDQNWTDLEAAIAARAALNHSHSMSQVSGLQAALDGKLNTSARGANNGVASLGADGKVPLNQLPDLGASANDMVFQTDTLTAADIGKLVVLKNGKVQLPEFTDAVEATLATVKIEFKGDFIQPILPRVEVYFETLPSDGEAFSVELYELGNDTKSLLTFTAKDTPVSAYEYAIGADVTETRNNFIAIFEALVSSEVLHPAYNVNAVVADKVDIISPFLGVSSDNDYWGDTASAAASISVSLYGNDSLYRYGSYNVALLPLVGLTYTYDDAQRNYLSSVPSWFVSQAANSLERYIDGTSSIPWLLPDNEAEMLAAIADVLQEHFEGCVSASVSGSIISAFFEYDSGNFAIDFGEFVDAQTLFDITYENLVVEGSANAAIPPICNLPVVGQVTNVVGSQVMISTQPIRSFLLKGDIGVSISAGFFPGFGLLDIARFCVLNWEDPGYLMSAANFIGSLGYDAVFMLKCAACGYVQAYQDADAETVFIGALSLDMTPITISLLLNED